MLEKAFKPRSPVAGRLRGKEFVVKTASTKKPCLTIRVEGVQPSRRAPRAERILRLWLEPLGVAVNGSAPCDIRVNHPQFFKRVLAEGFAGWGDSYIEGWWECEALDQLAARLLAPGAVMSAPRWSFLAYWLTTRHLHYAQPLACTPGFTSSAERADFELELFESLVGPRLMCSGGAWQKANTLDQAQEEQLNRICQKLDLKPGMTVLDLDCGWAAFLKIAAENYGIKGLGLTRSRRQYEYGRRSCKALPVSIRYKDYHSMRGQFDRIVSLNLLAAPRSERQPPSAVLPYCWECLKEDGLVFLLATTQTSTVKTAGWLQKHGLPCSEWPSLAPLEAVTQGSFLIREKANFGSDFERSLLSWFTNFDRQWPRLQNRFDPAYYRLWKFYLLTLAGSLRAQASQAWQMVLAKPPEGRQLN